MKAFTAMLNPIYNAPTKEAALEALGEPERLWEGGGAKFRLVSNPGEITGTNLRPHFIIRKRFAG
jgi:hypothetical protein